jgi:hypothetical protein
MKFEIRYQISDLEEEIYFFDVNESIAYTGFLSSIRNSINDPFGYDWSEHYREAKSQEIKALEDAFGDEIFDYDHPYHNEAQKVYDTYNPTMHGLLWGVTSCNIAKEYPLKISKEMVINTLIETIKLMEIR